MPRKPDEERLVKKMIYLTASGWRAVKVHAAMIDRGPSEIVREAVQECLAKHRAAARS